MGRIFPLLVRLTPPLIIINNLTIVNLFIVQSHTRGAILFRMGLVGILGWDESIGLRSVSPRAGLMFIFKFTLWQARSGNQTASLRGGSKP